MSIGRKNQARYRVRSSQAQANVKSQARMLLFSGKMNTNSVYGAYATTATPIYGSPSRPVDDRMPQIYGMTRDPKGGTVMMERMLQYRKALKGYARDPWNAPKPVNPVAAYYRLWNEIVALMNDPLMGNDRTPALYDMQDILPDELMDMRWAAWKAGQVLLPVTPDEWVALHQSASGNPFHQANLETQMVLWAIALREYHLRKAHPQLFEVPDGEQAPSPQ